MTHSVAISVGGIVQGVGFRPFVYALAKELGLHGWVRNDGAGASIRLEGDAIETFLARLHSELPPLARIDALHVTPCEVEGFTRFEIIASDSRSAKRAAISPDIALCDACARELADVRDRRYGYALINCTDCGPRYSIIRALPYDRANTTMAAFDMCGACAAEYKDPTSRRYHAQPIGCPECGPQLRYLEEGVHVSTKSPIAAAAQALLSGKIIALKGLGGFHLMCDATNEAAVAALRRRKRRKAKPLAVMVSDLSAVRRVAYPSAHEEALIASKERPIVLVSKAPNSLLAPSVAPNINRLGLFLPYTPLHVILLEQCGVPLVATSANLSDAPIERDEEGVWTHLGGVIDAMLTHERAIENAVDDSVMQMVGERALFVRMARGFAPYSYTLAAPVDRAVLAVGAQQKSSVALAFGTRVIVSPHIGDLGSVEAFDFFERTLSTFKRLYDFSPELIVHDLHPHYDTTRYALRSGVPTLGVQHHHAHIRSVMFDQGLRGEVLGFAFDGTGYGEDGSIWGGEVLRVHPEGFERLYHLRSFALFGGDLAAKEPWRCALGLLLEYFDLESVIALMPRIASERIRALYALRDNAPRCSSMGRLFDAVGYLLGLCDDVSFDGESGLRLEAAAQSAVEAEPFGYRCEGGIIDFEPMIREILTCKPPNAPARFIATLCAATLQIAKTHNLSVVLSGGVFQNRILLEALMHAFESEGIAYHLPLHVSVNDGGVALGQIAVALQRMDGLR